MSYELGFDCISQEGDNIIEEENEKLSREGIVHLQRAAEVSFSE